MKKIVFILPYFGQFNNYFPLFLKSCQFNSTIDWIVYTDNEVEYEWPQNVKKINITFEKLREKIQRCYPFQIALDVPYKLCDYKVAYGDIFAEDISGYDFWGFCDCDLILGNIRKYVTDRILNQYDKVFSRGHMQIFANKEQVINYYKKQKYVDYKKIFTDNHIYAFDEWKGCSRYWDLDHIPYYDELVMDDIDPNLNGFHTTKEIKGHDSPYHCQNANEAEKYASMSHIIYRYDHGSLRRIYEKDGELQEQEIIYVHMQKRNMSGKQGGISDMADAACWLIVPDKFEKDKKIEISVLKELSPDMLSFHNIKVQLRRKIRNLL